MTMAQIAILADRHAGTKKRKREYGNVNDLLALKARTKRRAS